MPRTPRVSVRPQPVQGAQLLDRAVSVLHVIAAEDHIGRKLQDIVKLSQLTAPTVHRLLRSLESHELVERDEVTGRYHLGRELASLGTIARWRHGIERAAAASLVFLARETGDTVLLTVRRGWHSLCVGREEGTFPIRSHVLRTGDRHPLGISSGGMAILASLGDEEVELSFEANASEIRADFPNYSLRTLREQVRETREMGYSLNPGQIIKESFGLAVPILEGRTCSAALTVAAIASRIAPERRGELAALMQNEATVISEKIAQDRSVLAT